MTLEYLIKLADVYLREIINPSSIAYCQWPKNKIRRTESFAFYGMIRAVHVTFVILFGMYMYRLGKPYINRRRTQSNRFVAKCLVLFLSVWVPLRFLWSQAMGYAGHFIAWFITLLPKKAGNKTMRFLNWFGPYFDWLELLLLALAFHAIFYQEIRRRIRYFPGFRRLFNVVGPPTCQTGNRADEQRQSICLVPNHTRSGTIYQPLDVHDDSYDQGSSPTNVAHISKRTLVSSGSNCRRRD